jgi:hypothetical protein
MEIAMRRALRRAGWALAAAGGIGITAPALGQSPAVRILGPAGHVVEGGAVVVAMTEGQARLEEGQVELAFLADPMLFSYGVGAHVDGVTLEVRGYVPTQAVREQALRVAKEHSTLNIVDKLKIHPTLATHGTVDRPENIQRAARALLEEAFLEHGKRMDVKCDARGHVTVSGPVGSQEEKLLVSRKLRQVAGCSCVHNQLNVPGEVAAVPPVEKEVVIFPDPAPMPAPAPTPGPVLLRPAVRKSEPLTPPVSGLPVSAPAKKVSDPPSPGTPRVYPGPVAPTPMPEPKPLPEPAHKATPPPAIDLPSLPTRPEPSKPAVVPSIDKDRSYGTGTPGARTFDVPPIGTVKPTQAPKLPESGSKAPLPPPLPDLPPATSAKPPPAVKSPETETKPAVPPLPDLPPTTSAKPAPSAKVPQIVSVPAVPPQKAPARDKNSVGGSEESYVAEGIVTFGQEEPPAKSAAVTKPAAVAKPPASTASPKPVEGTLTLTPPPMPPSSPAPVAPAAKVSAPPAAPAKVPAPPAPAAPLRSVVPPAVRLKERLQGICGPAYEVQVTPAKLHGTDALQVDIAGRSEADGQRLLERITPVIKSAEFSTIEINVDIVVPVK